MESGMEGDESGIGAASRTGKGDSYLRPLQEILYAKEVYEASREKKVS